MRNPITIIFQLFSRSKPREKAATKQDLDQLEERIMAKQSEIATGLTELQAQLTKVNDEVQGKIQELEDALNNQSEVTPELQQAFDALKVTVQTLDDIIPDAPTPPEEPPPLS